ncbi:zinc finger (ubiquitin-hydrolase) domain-containing protein [Rhynchospora pubera]|uniref:Zinc finger (Ubiquitin-hydrolase) domain-containing protein n=1 Tax=Rhynchospora pubera TaxID=906938 RepID=A0AAV8H7C1_9POAL|nr:zinc finger (ubiquitin-hydrolase) domain-containing protein [Rhynchospora pubera]
MFSLRIHSLELVDAAGVGPRSVTSAPNSVPNPHSRDSLDAPNSIRGIVHLYRNLPPHPPASYAAVASSSSSSSSTALPLPLPSHDSLLPLPVIFSSFLFLAFFISCLTIICLQPMRGKLLFLLAIANALSPDDFLWVCDSYLQHASNITFIRNDGMEDRYSVLLDFDDQIAADRCYLELNGCRFPSSDVGGACHVLFLLQADFTQSLEIAATPPLGSTELPTCPICIERLDQDITGIVTTTCDHSFQCSCVSKWVNSSCPVCHLCQDLSAKPTCSICETNENLWICVICGFVGCGRYKEGHAFRHWKDTQHCYSLDLETHRVWDYVGDNYVHRLNQSKSDNKLNKLRSKQEPDEIYGSCACSEDSGFSGAILSSKVDTIVEEYNALLASQLETQRQYYEQLISEARDQKEHFSSSVESGVNMKLQEIQQKIENVKKENRQLADMNGDLTRSQNIWRQKLEEIEERERETLKLKDIMIRDLEEQLRDFTVCIEAQKTIGKMTDADDVRGGMLLPVPSPPEKGKKSSRSNRRRN